MVVALDYVTHYLNAGNHQIDCVSSCTSGMDSRMSDLWEYQ